MVFKGFFVSHNNKKGFDTIIKRVRELGINVYIFHNCIPEYIITVKKGFMDYKTNDQILYFRCDNIDFDKLHLLGFGFEGLFEDEEKIKEIENFGRYRCIINDIDNISINEEYIELKEFILKN